jgi:hypothetical protein
MQSSIHRCRDLESAVGKRSDAFSKILALGWYDGPTDGVAQCATCSAVYKFHMLDEDRDWEDGQDVRIFSLAPLPAGALDKIVEVCPGAATAGWPVWAPTWRFESDAQQKTAEDTVTRILDSAGPAQFVVVSDDGLQSVEMCRPVKMEELATIEDWFALLGLPRREGADRA